MIKRTIVSREQDVVFRLYKSLVRPHLEYCVQAWSPYLRQAIDTLERIQRRATKMIRGLGKFTYEKRLMRCVLTNLERGHPFMTSTCRGSGLGGRMWTGVQAPCGRPHRKLKLESTDVTLSSSHAKKLASFLPEFRLWTE